MKKLKVVGLGISTIEYIPLFHYDPGGLALRVAIATDNELTYDCGNMFDICIYGEGREVFDPVPLEAETLIKYAKRLRADLLIFEGVDPITELDEDLVLKIKEAGLHVGTRSFGQYNPLLETLDVIVIDDIHVFSPDPGIVLDLYNLLEKILSNKQIPWIEINIYLEKPILAQITPLLDRINQSYVPLHIHIADHQGGGPVTSLYEKIKMKHPYVYIHNPVYPHLDTFCPKCGAPIAAREEGVLLSLEINNGKCWRCGSILHFKGRVRKKTPKNIIIVTGGEKWLDPRELKRLNSYFVHM